MLISGFQILFFTFFLLGVVLYSPWYVGSESMYGVNIWPTKQEHKFHYLLFTEMLFFEFIPIEHR